MGTWVSDAEKLGELHLSYVAKNKDISDFLERRNFDKHIIVSSKGMGKTLMLRLKREQVSQSKEGFFIVPQNEQNDYVNLPSSPNVELESSLRDKIFWEDLWKSSIAISLFLGHRININQDLENEISEQIENWNLPPDIEALIKRRITKHSAINKRPSSILDSFLTIGKPAIEKYRSKGQNKIWSLYLDTIQSACAVFIDSFDQELNRRNPGDLDIWCAGQAGLLKASWELSRHNKHVKVFVTIRQEAYSDTAYE